MKILTPRQRNFCRAFLLLGNATQAAVRAGYASGAAKQEGYRLLRKPAVRAEIDNLTQRQGHRVMALIDQTHSGGTLDPGQPGIHSMPSRPGPAAGTVTKDQSDRQIDECLERDLVEEASSEADFRLTRTWVLARLLENAEIALGRRKVSAVRVLDGREVTVQIYLPNAAAANRALEILLREVDRLEAAESSKEQIADQQLGEQDDLSEALAAFQSSLMPT